MHALCMRLFYHTILSTDYPCIRYGLHTVQILVPWYTHHRATKSPIFLGTDQGMAHGPTGADGAMPFPQESLATMPTRPMRALSTCAAIDTDISGDIGVDEMRAHLDMIYGKGALDDQTMLEILTVANTSGAACASSNHTSPVTTSPRKHLFDVEEFTAAISATCTRKDSGHHQRCCSEWSHQECIS